MAGQGAIRDGARVPEWVDDDSRLAIGLHFASLGVTFVVLAFLCRRYWYFGDDLGVLAVNRGAGVRGVFEPHSEHWQTLPKLLAQLNYAVLGLRSYWPTTIAVLATNTVVGHLLWRVMRRIGLSAWIATGLAAVYLVTLGDSTRDIMQIGWFTAVALGLGAILSVDSDEPNRRRELAAAGLLLVAVACMSGVAVVMLLAVALVALLRRGWRAALVVAVPPIALFLLWLAVIGNEQANRELPDGVPLGEVPRFVVTELPGTVASPTRLGTATAALALVGVGAWLVVRWREAVTVRAPAFAMALVLVPLFLAVAQNRTVVAYRYDYLAWLLFLPAFGVVLHDVARRPQWRCALAIGVSAVLGLAGLAHFVDVAHAQTSARRVLKTELAEMGRRVRSDGFVPEVLVDNERVGLLRADDVAAWARAGKLPRPERPPSPAELRDITARLQVRWVPRPPASYDTGGRPAVVAVTGAEVVPAGDGCLRLEPAVAVRRIELDLPRRAAVRVGGARTLDLSLPSLGDDGSRATITVPVLHGDTEYVEFASGTHPAIEVGPRGAVTICGIDAPTGLDRAE
jgi:hypothetical protein